VGDDVAGDTFIALLEEGSMTTEGIVRSKHRMTTLKERLIGGAQQLLRVDAESDALLNAEEDADMMQAITNLLPQADVVIFQDYDKGVLDARRIASTVQLAEKNHIPTVVDPKKRNFLHYQQATLFKPNLKELKEGLQPTGFVWPEHITGANLDRLITEASEKIKALTQVKNTLITLSERGVFIDAVYTGRRERHVLPAHVRQIADVSGAGDTVVSIAALCLALNLPPAFLAGLSNLGGGLVCESVGVVPIDKSQLMKEAKKYWEHS
jgi:rfaE bifunctional protein kinase chain/domain